MLSPIPVILFYCLEIAGFFRNTEEESFFFTPESPFCKLSFVDWATAQKDKKRDNISSAFLTKHANLSEAMKSLKNSLQNQNELLIASGLALNHFFCQWPRQD